MAWELKWIWPVGNYDVNLQVHVSTVLQEAVMYDFMWCSV